MVTWAVRFCVSIALACVSLHATGTSAQSPGSSRAEARRAIEEGVRAYAELDFPLCVQTMRGVLALSGLSDPDRLEALEYLGSALVVLEREEAARDAFTRMLALDPYHVVREPTGSPKISRFVAELRAEQVPDAALDPRVALELQLPARAQVGEDVVARVDASRVSDDAAEITTVTLFVREPEASGFAASETERQGGGRFEVTLSPRDVGELAIYAEGRDDEGRVVARAAEPLAPRVLSVEAEAVTPRKSKWWVGVIVGVVVVGAAAAVAVTLSRRERIAPGTLPPGRVQLP